MPVEGEKYYFIGSLAKGLRVLELLVDQNEMTVTEVARHFGFNRASSHRFLATLKTLGYVDKNSNKRYQPTFKILELGMRVAGQFEIRQVARPFMAELSEACKETVNLGVLDGLEVLHIDKIESQNILRMDSPIGSKAPSYCTALGKAILAHLLEDEFEKLFAKMKLKPCGPNTITSRKHFRKELEEINTRGYSVDNEELAKGLRCIGAPIFDYTSRPRYAISISGPAERMDAERIDILQVQVRDACQAISRRLGKPSEPNKDHGKKLKK